MPSGPRTPPRPVPEAYSARSRGPRSFPRWFDQRRLPVRVERTNLADLPRPRTQMMMNLGGYSRKYNHDFSNSTFARCQRRLGPRKVTSGLGSA